jgi:hypothetical protein
MQASQLCSRSVDASGLKNLLKSLAGRGVRGLDGCILMGGRSRGAPPSQAMTPRVVMEAGSTPLTDPEQAETVEFLRHQVLTILAAELVDSPMSVDMVEARYCIMHQQGLELVVEMHGLVDRVARVSIS